MYDILNTFLFMFFLQGNIHSTIPSILFGSCAVVAGFMALLLPETRNLGLPDTVEEIEALPR